MDYAGRIHHKTGGKDSLFWSKYVYGQQERPQLCRVGDHEDIEESDDCDDGEVLTREEVTVCVKALDLFVTVMLLEETPAVLSLGKLCEDHEYTYHWTSGQKPHLTKNGQNINTLPGDFCLRTKITRASCRRRTGTVVPRAGNFGVLITADHNFLCEGCESRNNPRHAVDVKQKTSQETQKSLQKFLEPTRKPKVMHSHNSLEFGKACDELSWNHCTSTPHRLETKWCNGRISPYFC